MRLATMVAQLCIGMAIYAGDRIGDDGYNARFLKGTVLASAAGFVAFADKMAYCSLLVFSGALMLYKQVKGVPYLKIVWFPWAYAQAMCSGIGAHNFFDLAILPVSMWAFLWVFGSCASCDIKDIEDDSSRGVKTLATKFGARATRMISAGAVLAGCTSVALTIHFAALDCCCWYKEVPRHKRRHSELELEERRPHS